MWKSICLVSFNLASILCTDIAVNCHTKETELPSDLQLACQFATKQLNFKVHTPSANISKDPLNDSSIPVNISATLQLSLTSISFHKNGLLYRCVTGDTFNGSFICMSVDADAKLEEGGNKTEEDEGVEEDDPRVIAEEKGNEVSLRIIAASVTTAVFVCVLTVGVFCTKHVEPPIIRKKEPEGMIADPQ